MSKYVWQVIAHQPRGLSPAQGSVWTAIARRVNPLTGAAEMPYRTLYAESVAVGSKRTVERAITHLESLKLISIVKPTPGTRKPTKFQWLLECPADCNLDHENENVSA